MFKLFKGSPQQKKNLFSLLIFFFLLFSVPISGYFLITDYDFDRRTEAAIFNNLVLEMEEKIGGAEHVPGMIRLEFPNYVSNDEIERVIGRARSTPEELLGTPYERVEYVEVNAEKMAEEMARYMRYTPVYDVDLNYISYSFWRADGNDRVLSNDWNAANHWYFNNIKLPEVWKIQGCLEGSDTCGGSKNITVAVIDTGLALGAPEAKGMNLSSKTPSGMHDDQGHGTFVAGVIASATNNAASSVGMAHNVTIMPIKANRPFEGRFTAEAIEQAIYYAGNNGADVINLSLGSCSHSGPWNTALRWAVRDKGIVVVAASGNAGSHPRDPCHPNNFRYQVGYPANHPDVIAVGSVNANNSRSSYSHYGSNLDFVAPAGQGRSAGDAAWQQTLSCALSRNCNRGNINSYANAYMVGTSFAAPQVAGAVGLILSLSPSLTPAQVKDVLIRTVDDIGAPGKDAQTGYGLLNLKNIYTGFAPSCGSLDKKEFEHTEKNWPSANFCSSGSVEPSNPVFPELGGKTNWSCKGGDSSKVSCSASRKAPPKPVCGELNGMNFEPEDTRWPSRDFCAGGVAEPRAPQFPSFGGSTQWRCFESYDNSFVSCSASRKIAPPSSCGSLDGSRFLPEEEKWPSESFCSAGVSSPRSPRFPAKGRVTTWRCIALDNQSVTCSAERGSCFSSSDCRTRPPYEICVKHFCLRGDILQDGKVGGGDFAAFKADFAAFKEGRWKSSLLRSDLNTDYKITMADYSIFVRTYRAFNNLD